MRGDRSERESGQLALMDALVFFSIAILASGVMISYVESSQREVVTGVETPPVDMYEILSVVLGSSICYEVGAPLGLEVNGRESVAECLAAELYGLSMNVERQLFEGLNDAVGKVVDTLLGPLFDWRIVIVHPLGRSSEPCLAIPGPPVPCGLAYAASTELLGSDGVLYTIILVLQPATPSELVQV